MPHRPARYLRPGVETKSERDRVYDRYARWAKHGGFYQSAAWKRARDVHIREFPLCARHSARCEVVLGSVVDHIVPREFAPDRELDPANLQTLCAACHAVKTAEDEKKYRTQK